MKQAEQWEVGYIFSATELLSLYLLSKLGFGIRKIAIGLVDLNHYSSTSSNPTGNPTSSGREVIKIVQKEEGPLEPNSAQPERASVCVLQAA